jgi:hypothetical protein
MTLLGQRFAILGVAFFLVLSLFAPRVQAGAYEAELPAELATAKDMCALLPCAEVFPGAKHFSERKGQPPYVEAYDNDTAEKKLLGYVMLSTDITDTPAYSGKPVVTLIGMDLRVFMVDQYRRAKTLVLDIRHGWFHDPITSRSNSCFTLWAARSVLDNPSGLRSNDFHPPRNTARSHPMACRRTSCARSRCFLNKAPLGQAWHAAVFTFQFQETPHAKTHLCPRRSRAGVLPDRLRRQEAR